MFLAYEQIVAGSAAKDWTDLTIHARATHASLQASEQNVRYTMDGTTVPTEGATGTGMVLVAGDDPKIFQIEDIKRIRFVRGAGSDGKLNIHYSGGRDI